MFCLHMHIGRMGKVDLTSLTGHFFRGEIQRGCSVFHIQLHTLARFGFCNVHTTIKIETKKVVAML